MRIASCNPQVDASLPSTGTNIFEYMGEEYRLQVVPGLFAGALLLSRSACRIIFRYVR